MRKFKHYNKKEQLKIIYKPLAVSPLASRVSVFKGVRIEEQKNS